MMNEAEFSLAVALAAVSPGIRASDMIQARSPEVQVAGLLPGS